MEVLDHRATEQARIGIHGNEVALALTTDTAGTLTADEVALARRIQRVAGGHHHPVGLAGS